MTTEVIKLKEVNSWAEIPNSGGLQLWNPAYRRGTIEQLSKETKVYADVYSHGYFCRETATIHLFY